LEEEFEEECEENREEECEEKCEEECEEVTYSGVGNFVRDVKRWMNFTGK